MMTLYAVLLALAATGCMDDDFSDCFYGVTVKVVVSADGSGQNNGLTPDVFDNIMLYVFGEDGVLLAIIPTEINRTEVLNYPDAGKMTVVAIANKGAGDEMTAMTTGVTTLNDARIMLTRSADPAYYAFMSDIFTGDKVVDNNTASGKTVELPIRRIVAGVYVYVRGVNEYMSEPGATAGDFHVVLGGQYNYIDFKGTPSYMAGRSMTDPVLYKFTGTRRSGFTTSYYDFPHQAVPATRTDYMTMLASDAGMPVSVGLYYKGQMVTAAPITTDGANPLTVRNNMLNVIAIDFRGSVSVTINQTAWGSVVDVEKEYGQ